VKSVYVGRGEIARLISQFQASSTAVERIVRANSENESKKAEAALERATELIHLVTNAALLVAGFHTHKRQWRRKRNAGS
jgi:predicted transporter